MSYQDKKYNQNNKFNRNSVGLVYNTSSDLCFFNKPNFIVTGADKIRCSDTSFNVSGVSFNDILSSTTECFITNELSGSCFNNITWNTLIYEEDRLVDSREFYISEVISGDTPNIEILVNSLNESFNTLNYDYENEGTNFLINQVKNSKNLNIFIDTKINYQEDCPIVGLSGLTFTGFCEDIITNVVDIDFSGLTVNDDNVYSLLEGDSIDFKFNFTENTESFIENDAIFKFDIYDYNEVLKSFNKTPKYSSNSYDWGVISGTSALTESILINNLSLDGNYLIKGYYVYDSCTEFANLSNVSYSTKNNSNPSLYDETFDYFFVAFNAPDVPIFEGGDTSAREFGFLNSISEVLTGEEEFIKFPKYTGDLIVNLNGLTLSLGEDYEFQTDGPGLNNAIKLFGDVFEGDIVTFIYTNTTTDRSSLKKDTIDINSQIPSGPIDNQGNNKVYYNTTKSKYEIYTELLPSQFNDIVVTVNGMTLANNVDYYRSDSNKYRLILEGDLVVGDIVSIWYGTDNQINGDVFTDTLNIEWFIFNEPKKNNGIFKLQLSDTEDFSNIVSEDLVEYVVGGLSYSKVLGVLGDLGQTMYYRVINQKRFLDVCNNPIITEVSSDVVKIIVQTNSINSY